MSQENRSLEIRTLMVLESLNVLLTRLRDCSVHDFRTRWQEEVDVPLEDAKALTKQWYIKLSLEPRRSSDESEVPAYDGFP